MVNTQPTLDLIILALYKSLLGFAINTAVTFAASAVLKRAPIFPGFSIPSATKINGVFVLNWIFFSEKSFAFATAIIPSVESL